MDSFFSKIIVLFSLVVSLNAFSGSPAPKKNKLLPARRLASLETNSETDYRSVRAEEKTAKSPKNFQLRLGLTAGLGTSTGSEVSSASDLGVGADKNLSFAFNADVTMFRHFGFELEGSSGFKASQSNSVDAETPFTQVRERSINGAMANLKGQIPLRIGRSRLTPKVGLGYGVVQLKDTVSLAGFEDASSSDTVAVMNVPYVVGGIDFNLNPRWLFSADFAKSVGGSGHLDFSNSQSELALREIGVTRLRASVSYRLNPTLSLGGQYVLRSFSFSQPLGDGDTFPSAVNQNQFLGLVQFDL